MNPLVKQYLESKLGQDYEQKRQDELANAKSSAGLGNLFGDIGDVIAGNKIGSTDQFFNNKVKSIQDAQSEKEKKALAEYDIEKSMKSDVVNQEKLDRKNKLDSIETQTSQDAAIALGMKPELVKNMTAAQLEDLSPVLKMKSDQLNKNREFDLKKQENALKHQENALKLNMVNKDIQKLPEEDQIVVKDLARKNTDKIAIKSQIDAVLNKLPNLSEDQQLQQGRQLIKVLNSTQGADAVGAEEAKRLAGKLDFAMGNVFNNNPIQFGRDLKGFFQDAKITSDSLGESVKQNNNIIKNAYSRVGLQKDPSAILEQGKTKKTVVDTQVNKKTGQRRLVYSDGTTEILNNIVGQND